MRCLGLIVLVGVLLSTGSTASAAPGVVQELPGCTTELPANDDDSTDAVALGFTAELFDTSFDAVFVNNNGNVTIGEALSEFTPFDFRETSQAMIAPFFADVDTRGAGSGLVRYGLTTYDGSPAFCVIWDDVGYFAEHDDKLNRFQLIIVDRSDGIDLVFNYDAITWETGDASDGSGGFGGISAVAGYAAGDGDAAHASMLPGSFVNGGLLDTNAATSLAGHSTAGQPAGRYIFALRPGPPTGGRLTGTVTDPNGDPVSGAVVQICPDSGPCLTRLTSGTGIYSASNLAAGNYDVSAFPGPGPSFAPARAGDVGVDAPGTTTTQDLQLGPVPPPPPDGTTITSIGTTDDGLPVAYWDDQLELVTQGCPGATATYQVLLAGQVVRDGSLAESPAGTYRAMIAPLEPNLGDGVITIELDCPAVPDDEVVEFGIYIDPSGVVRDEAGRPVEGATVTLSRSADPAGPFFPVPDGSAIMSPANRLNPDASRSDGRFGWDVVAGYYVVAASKAGCVSAKTAVLTIPPPVTDLDLRLDCTPPATSSMTTGGMGSGGIVQLPSSAPKLAKVGKVKLSKGRALVVAIACAPVAKLACAGKVTVALKGKVLGSKRYRNVKPGKTARVKVAFSKRGRSRIAKIKRGKKIKLRVTATVKDAAGTGATAKRTVTVRR